MPRAPIPDLVPDLAVEVLSESNTAAEMARKRANISPPASGWSGRRPAGADRHGPRRPRTGGRILDESETLDGGAVLPGFALPLRDLFAELDRKKP